VSIGEVFATGSLVQCFDNSTRGLDSSTALDFVKALRVVTDLGQKTTLATLYQAGEELYNHFDKVILLEEGYQVFFGRTDEARAYFTRLGFQGPAGLTTAEFLIAMLDPELRIVTPGSRAENIHTAADLAAAFRQSENYAALQAEIRNTTSSSTSATGLVAGSQHVLSYPSQIMECLRREYQLAHRQSMVYKGKWITAIILSFTIGSMYFDTTNTSQGVYTRGGILFFALIFNGWLQFPELFDAHTNRSVLERQANLHLYRPSTVAIARFMIDVPLIAVTVMVGLIPYYFLTRLQVDAGKFFFMYLTLFLSSVSFSNLLRMFAYYVETLDDCFRYGGFSCTVLILFSGFLISPNSMRPYFGWLRWINPMFYAYENLFVNELVGLNIDCTDGNLVPAPTGANIANQICAVAGAVPGQSYVTGANYTLAQGFDFDHRWRNVGIIIAIAMTYLFVGAIGSETMSFASNGGTYLSFVKKRSGAVPSSASADTEKSEKSADAPSAAALGEIILSWQKFTVDIGEKRILKGITGYTRRGAMTAMCGASGAGKTTLLSQLSRTATVGTPGGDVWFRSRAPGPEFRKVTGFAQQADLHDGTATVREALEFSALLRQPRHYTRAEKLAYVEEIMDSLDLRQYENVLIGEETTGLGVEQKKRVTIGVELAARPEVLFVDEPTSGLDSEGALRVITYLRILSRQGQAILVTIHQPSALLFSRFDNLLVLSSQGEEVYFGQANTAIEYFDRQGAPCPKDANPADFVLETIGAGVNARLNDTGANWAQKWRESPEAAALDATINEYNQSSIKNTAAEDADAAKTPDYNASIFLQTWLLTKRILLNQWRNPPYVYSKIWVHALSGLLAGVAFYKLGSSPTELQNRALSVFNIVFLVNAVVNVILARFFFQGLYWRFREGPSNTYNWVALCNASILAEMPAAVFSTIVFYLLWYFVAGLPLHNAGFIFVAFLTYEVFQVLLGLFMMALSPDLGFAGNVLVFIVCTCNWFNGIIVPYNQIQVFWRYWLYYLSPYTYLLGGMVKAVVEGAQVVCSDKDLVTFNPPAGQSCGAYASEWAANASAQLLNPSAMEACNVCKWTSGDQFLDQFNLGPSGLLGSHWEYWGVFMAFTVSNLALVYYFTWATKVKGWKPFGFF
jgi:ATP-binding cassette subfamily G (WHITE) protein 2 (SNQ2)